MPYCCIARNWLLDNDMRLNTQYGTTNIVQPMHTTVINCYYVNGCLLLVTEFVYAQFNTRLLTMANMYGMVALSFP